MAIGEIILVSGPFHGLVMMKPQPRIDPRPLPDHIQKDEYLATDQYDEEMREIWVWSNEDRPLRTQAREEE